MMFQEAKTMFRRDDSIDVIKFNVVVSGTFQDMYDLEELLNAIVLFYHDDVDIDYSASSFSSQKSKDTKHCYFSDSILHAVEMLIDDASYGIFKPRAYDNSLIELLKFIK